MSSINEVVIEGTLKSYEEKGSYALATIQVETFNAREKKFTPVVIPVVATWNTGPNAKPPPHDKLVDGKPVRFKGEIKVRDGKIGLAGSLKLHYLGEFKPKDDVSPAGNSVVVVDDEPPF